MKTRVSVRRQAGQFMDFADVDAAERRAAAGGLALLSVPAPPPDLPPSWAAPETPATPAAWDPPAGGGAE